MVFEGHRQLCVSFLKLKNLQGCENTAIGMIMNLL